MLAQAPGLRCGVAGTRTTLTPAPLPLSRARGWLHLCFDLRPVSSRLGRQHPAPDLVALHRLEQRLEVALAEAVVALALDELEEHRAEQRLREDLQQQPLAAVLG